MSERKKPQVGDAVVYHDTKGRPHNALISCVHSDFMINLLHLAGAETQRDQYGRQTVHQSSIPMKGCGYVVHGNYARYPDEEPVPYREPQAV